MRDRYTINKVANHWKRRARYEVRFDRISDDDPGDCLGVFKTYDEADDFIDQLVDNKLKHETATKFKP